MRLLVPPLATFTLAAIAAIATLASTPSHAQTSAQTSVGASAQTWPHTCTRAFCSVDAPGVGLRGVPVRAGWTLEEPYIYETAGGARASVPTLVLAHADGSFIVVNGRQVTEAGHECADGGPDRFCLSRPATREGRRMVRALRRWREATR